MGPAFVAAIAYVDPGNFATNIAAGSTYGYLLVWVIVASNVMAMLIQYLSAKAGLATGKGLAALCRDESPRSVVFMLWMLAETVAIATDLAEVVGGAIALQLLFDIPLVTGGVLTAVVAFGLLGLHSRGARRFEVVITGCLAVILVGFLYNLVHSGASSRGLVEGLVPRFQGTDSMLLATGILGATVMPHAIYLHGDLTSRRYAGSSPWERQAALRDQRIGVVVAMTCAGLMNLALLIIAACALAGHAGDVDTLEAAHHALSARLGASSGWLFALTLLASGFAASSVGTLSGQVVMDGFLNIRIPLALRRLSTLVPALVILAVGVDPTRALVLSQVVLSFGIPFALVPLVMFTRRAEVMGSLVNRATTTVAAAGVAVVIIALNILLIVETIRAAT